MTDAEKEDRLKELLILGDKIKQLEEQNAKLISQMEDASAISGEINVKYRQLEADNLVMQEALGKIEISNAESINGLLRGFIGNAEEDIRNSQRIVRDAISKCQNTLQLQKEREAAISFESWQKITRLLLDFYSLSETAKSQIFLMMDGLKYRKEQSGTRQN